MIGLAEYYHCRPSSFLDSAEEYEKYCLDEACAYIQMRIKDGEKPNFGKAKTKGKRYKSFTDFYNEYID